MKYAYDVDGFYTGIARPDSLGLYPSNSTAIEPKWVDGYKPKFEAERGLWTNVKREDCDVVRAENLLVREMRKELAALKLYVDRTNELMFALGDAVQGVDKKIMHNYAELDEKMKKYHVCIEKQLDFMHDRNCDHYSSLHHLVKHKPTDWQSLVKWLTSKKNQLKNMIRKFLGQ